jgi:hypothetical protein
MKTLYLQTRKKKNVQRRPTVSMGGWVGVPKIKQIKFTELGVHIPNKKYIYKKIKIKTFQ